MLVLGIVLCVIGLACFITALIVWLQEDNREMGSFMAVSSFLFCVVGVCLLCDSTCSSCKEKKVTCTEYRIEEVTTMRGDSVANKTYEIYYKK